MSLLGLFVSAYLYLYKIGRIGTLACGSGGCETVQTSSWSRFLGVEVALIGVLGYALLLVVALVALRPGQVERRRPALLLAGAGGGRRPVHALSHLSRALRHPRHLPLVRRLGGHHRDDPGACSARPAPPPYRLPPSVDRDAKAPPKGLALAGALPDGALGVVYGDIGTSPLYALKECFDGAHGVPPTRGERARRALAGVLVAQLRRRRSSTSRFVMRADNRGEGGILALLALVRPRGAPAIGARAAAHAASVCSARRCSTATASSRPPSRCSARSRASRSPRPRFEPFVVPIAVVILVGAVHVAAAGHRGIGAVFGPIMAVWFICIACSGIRGIMLHPSVLARAQSRATPSTSSRATACQGFLVLGVGGAGDHRRRGAVRRHGPLRPPADPARLVRAGPAVAAAQLLRPGRAAARATRRRRATRSTRWCPGWGLYPMVVIATAAAIVASQALISGAFSLTRQAVQLGLLPARDHRAHLARPRSGRSTSPR